jgi:GNAT superfamily N-acetyltransferase
MIFTALAEAADHEELLLVTGGLCRFHPRRDGIVTIRELLVLPAMRREGIGRALVEEVQRRHPEAILRAVCPINYPANGFWHHIGFKAMTKGTGLTEIWERHPST